MYRGIRPPIVAMIVIASVLGCSRSSDSDVRVVADEQPRDTSSTSATTAAAEPMPAACSEVASRFEDKSARVSRSEVVTRDQFFAAMASWGLSRASYAQFRELSPSSTVTVCIIHGEALAPTHGPPPEPGAAFEPYFTSMQVAITDQGDAVTLTSGFSDRTDGIVNLLPSDADAS